MQFNGHRLRAEHKYYLHLHDYLTLQRNVAAFLPMDSHSIDVEGYNIRSLYFDNYLRSALEEKNDGIFKREKFRIRIYNGSDRVIKLERKSKFGEYVSKESALLSRDEYERIMRGEHSFLLDREERLLQEFYLALAANHYRPKVIVDYWREAYVSPLGNVRITFDKKLSAGVNTNDMFHPALILEEALPAEKTIMEIKFDSFLPNHIKQLLHPKSHIRTSISKYVICREKSIQYFHE